MRLHQSQVVGRQQPLWNGVGSGTEIATLGVLDGRACHAVADEFICVSVPLRPRCEMVTEVLAWERSLVGPAVCNRNRLLVQGARKV
jgi:hypothetical protein